MAQARSRHEFCLATIGRDGPTSQDREAEVFRLTNPIREYPWGSATAIPDLLGTPATGRPAAELWLGAHPSAPSAASTKAGERRLDILIEDDVAANLGGDVVARFGPQLPYLLKVIAVERPLSLQVHPHAERAREGFAAEDAAGIDLGDARRNYKDRNHKPELVYALTHFDALSGFRAPRRAAELFAGLDAPLARALHADLVREPSFRGIRTVFRQLLDPDLRPTPDAVEAVVAACRLRLADGSPSPRADGTVVLLGQAYPGDPGVVTSLLLNPVTLEPGEAMFVPAGGVHAYLHGTAVEVMANSDNVLRAGLTAKHIDIPELLANVDYVAAPPIRVAPEVFYGATRVFYAPVDDFELSVTTVDDDAEHALPGRGPRILLCLEGLLGVHAATGAGAELSRGESVFVPASDGGLTLRGRGSVVQADVP